MVFSMVVYFFVIIHLYWGNYLFKRGYLFDYEPYININGKAYFPDFMVGNFIIEATEWKHPSILKLSNLKNKIKNYKKAGFRIVFFIPKNFRKFYKEISDSCISALPEIDHFLMPL